MSYAFQDDPQQKQTDSFISSLEARASWCVVCKSSRPQILFVRQSVKGAQHSPAASVSDSKQEQMPSGLLGLPTCVVKLLVTAESGGPR